MDNLIKIYNNALNPEICQFIINKFESSQSQVEGMSGGGIRKHIKASTDLMIHDEVGRDEDWKYIYEYLMENLLSHLVDYLETNDFPVLNNNFSDTRNKDIHGANSLAILIHPHIERLDFLRIVRNHHRFFEDILR